MTKYIWLISFTICFFNGITGGDPAWFVAAINALGAFVNDSSRKQT